MVMGLVEPEAHTERAGKKKGTDPVHWPRMLAITVLSQLEVQHMHLQVWQVLYVHVMHVGCNTTCLA